jgi:uncharacterized paraquat-inducible protein A
MPMAFQTDAVRLRCSKNQPDQIKEACPQCGSKTYSYTVSANLSNWMPALWASSWKKKHSYPAAVRI